MHGKSYAQDQVVKVDNNVYVSMRGARNNEMGGLASLARPRDTSILVP